MTLLQSENEPSIEQSTTQVRPIPLLNFGPKSPRALGTNDLFEDPWIFNLQEMFLSYTTYHQPIFYFYSSWLVANSPLKV